MTRPRLVIVGPASPFRGGIAHFSNRWAQALAAQFDVRMLTFSRQYPKMLFPGKTQLESTAWDLPHTPERYIDSIDPLSWLKAGRWIAAQRPDVVMLVHWLPFFVPAYLGVLRAMRRSLDKYGVSQPHVTLFLHNVRPHNRFPLTDPLMQRLFGAADSFVTLSDKITRELHELAPDAPTLEGFHPVYDMFEAPLPPADARERLGLPERPTMLFFGYVRHYKGLDVLIEALPRVREQRDVQLVVAGEFYDREAEIRARVTDLGLDDAVRFFADYIPNEEVHLYFSAADVVVQPYRSATPSGAAQTAFFFGKPIVVTDMGVLREVVLPEDGAPAGIVVPPEDPDALADGILAFFDGDPEALAEGARTQATRYSWDALADRLYDFLQDQAASPLSSTTT